MTTTVTLTRSLATEKIEDPVFCKNRCFPRKPLLLILSLEGKSTGWQEGVLKFVQTELRAIAGGVVTRATGRTFKRQISWRPPH